MRRIKLRLERKKAPVPAEIIEVMECVDRTIYLVRFLEDHPPTMIFKMSRHPRHYLRYVGNTPCFCEVEEA